MLKTVLTLYATEITNFSTYWQLSYLNNTTEGLLTQLALTYHWGISQSGGNLSSGTKV